MVNPHGFLQVQTDALADLHLKVGMMWLGLLDEIYYPSHGLFNGLLLGMGYSGVISGLFDEFLMAY